MGYPLVLLAGIPASGKSHFGRWLEEQRGFLHLDVEKDGRLATLRLEGAWTRCFEMQDVTTFVSQIRAMNRPVLVNWGFPVHCLEMVKQLKSQGLVLWWFSADPEQAEREFKKRGDVPLAAFERQMTAISQHWNAIEAVFRPNVVTTLDSLGGRTDPAELFESMFGRAV
jgi:shikimate kinase